jgi:hypothetical protein
MKRLILATAFCALVICQGKAQTDSLATVRFYSSKPKHGGTARPYEILSSAETLAASEEGLEVLFHCMPATYTFSIKGSGQPVTVIAQMGAEYFIEISPGGSPPMKVKSKEAGEEDLRKLRGL